MEVNVMNWSVPHISFPKWLLPYGFKTGAAESSSKTESNHNDMDLISQLSDDLLILIVGRLPTKDAVRTSILSNRWRSIYKFAPDVDLKSEYLVGTSPCCIVTFLTALERFLKLRSGCKIRCLNLTCYFIKSDACQHAKFILKLEELLLGIESLSLHYSTASSDRLFPCLIISKIPSLTYLSLEYCTLLRAFDHVLTQSNSLQVLRLVGVTVRTGALECILANCLSLHSLSMDICEIGSKLIIRGPNLKLKSLCVRGCIDLEEIELYASNLATFEFESLDMVNIRFEHVPELESMFLDCENVTTMSNVCKNLVRVLPHMKSLIFGTKGDIYQVIISEVICSRSMGINTFSNLTQLSMHLESTKGVNLLSLVLFLESCPLLQEFHLNTELVEYNDWKHTTRLTAVIQELKKVEITGYSGTKPEIEFALYILKSAIDLEQMQIIRCSKQYNGRGSWSGGDEPPWNKRTSKMIHRQLQNQAISQNARLIIQHSPVSLNCRSLLNIVDN
ncbi:hypothetical protein CASFOL_016263 [Castilleja foliolosa]|uniref:F-box domain-containing protein n=1 Tax=Castilleja foliolosa TaxID=1961234 RepID=A0ABD3DG31_9LAMI